MSRCQQGSLWLSLASLVHSSREVFQAKSCLGTELLYIGSICSSKLSSSIWRGAQKKIAYEFDLTSPAVSLLFSLSNLDSFRDGSKMVEQLLFCGVLLPGLVQYRSQHSCLIAVKLFLLSFVSMPCIHIAESTLTQLGKNCVLFHRPGLTSIWPINYH